MLLIALNATEKRTHDYVRHGPTNLFGALNVGTGEVFGECKPTRDGENFLVFLEKAVKRHVGRGIHVVLATSKTGSTSPVEKYGKPGNQGLVEGFWPDK